MRIIAIDPGVSGGIAVWSGASRSIGTFSMPPTEGDFVELISDLARQASLEGEPMLAVVERVNGFAGKAQPGSRMFTFGESFGFIKGVLAAKLVPVELVTPMKWQRDLGLIRPRTSSRTQWKNTLKGRAQQSHPDQGVTLQTADALLILDWALEFCPKVHHMMPLRHCRDHPALSVTS